MFHCVCASVLSSSVSSMNCLLFFFFFQAEDGIRDVAVTGVQTCALPIFDPVPPEGPERPRVPGGPLHQRRHRAAPGLMDPSLYVILDRAAARGRDLEAILDGALAGGCRMIQLREKEWPSGRLLPLAERLCERCHRAGATFIVNDRVDLRSEEHTSELQSRLHLVCRLLLEKKKMNNCKAIYHSRKRR